MRTFQPPTDVGADDGRREAQRSPQMPPLPRRGDDKDTGSNHFQVRLGGPTRIFVMLSFMSTSERQYAKYIGDILRHFGTRRGRLARCGARTRSHGGLSAFLFLSSPFFRLFLQHAKPSELSVCKYNLRCWLYIHFLCFVRLSKP